MAEAAFDKYDADKNGEIDQEEFGKALTDLRESKGMSRPRESDIVNAWKVVDSNGDGKIDKKEFVEWWTKHGSN